MFSKTQNSRKLRLRLRLRLRLDLRPLVKLGPVVYMAVKKQHLFEIIFSCQKASIIT